MAFPFCTFRALDAAGTGSTGTTVTGNKPSGTASGDLMVAFIISSSASFTLDARPSGWAALTSNETVADFTMWAEWKAAGGSEPSTYDWTLSGSGAWRVIIVTLIGPNASDPIHTATTNDGASINTINITGPVYDTDNVYQLYMAAVDATGGARTWSSATFPGDSSELYDGMLNALHVGIWGRNNENGLVGQTGTTADLTVSGSAQDMACFRIAIRPDEVQSGVSYAQVTTGGLVKVALYFEYDPGDDELLRITTVNIPNSAVTARVKFTDGTTTWTQEVGPDTTTTTDVSSGSSTFKWNTGTLEFDATNCDFEIRTN